MTEPWVLTGATVVYRCGLCARTFTHNVTGHGPGSYMVPLAATCGCGGLVGLAHVHYETEGAVPMGGAENAFEPGDVDAAAALGIELKPAATGGTNEGDENDDVLWN